MSQLYRRYLFSTAAYVVAAVIAIGLAVVTFLSGHLLTSLILILAFGVALDNIFCGDRCRIAGGTANGHYTIPFSRKNAPLVAKAPIKRK